MKWIDEKVLQKYFKESFEQYNNWFLKEFDEKLVSVEYNQPFDRFPDLYGVLESGKRIGMEVEWTTKDFNHDHSVISDGLIIVLQNNDPFFELKQLELSKEKFEKWYVKNSKRIFTESVNTVIKDKSKIKRPPKLWFYYSGTDSFKNREKTLQSKTFGVPFNFRQKERFQDIRKGDLFCFIGPFKNMRGGRVQFDEFKKNRKLLCKDLTLVRITTDYFYDENEIWEHKVNYLTDDNLKNYPHRFNFDSQHILNLKDIKIGRLSLTSKKGLHTLLYTIFWDGKPELLIDLISRSK
jgi:hypothetical protein